MLLSNEAQREALRGARRLREERRAQLDTRHQHLILCLSEATTLGPGDVEEALLSDPQVDTPLASYRPQLWSSISPVFTDV